MRILILNTFPVWGGDEKWTINVGVGLKAKGHHVVISSPPGSETEAKAKENMLPVFPYDIGPDIAFWKIPKLMRFLKKNAIEVMLCVQNRDVKIGALAARMAGTPAIFARSGLDTMKPKFSHKIPFTKFIDGIITNTKSIKELYESYGWFEHDFVQVVYDGLVLPEKLDVIDLYKEFTLLPGSKVILGTGRLSEQKRFDLLIQVAAMAKKQNLDWSFVIAGTGRLESELKNMAENHGVSDIIKFVGFRNDVLTIMNSADIFVLSSDSEGMSNALREAMAVGKACVATEVFGVSELFQGGKSGLKVKKGDAIGIFNAIEKLLSDYNLRTSISKSGMELIHNSFTMENMIHGIETVFSNQLEKKGLLN